MNDNFTGNMLVLSESTPFRQTSTLTSRLFLAEATYQVISGQRLMQSPTAKQATASACYLPYRSQNTCLETSYSYHQCPIIASILMVMTKNLLLSSCMGTCSTNSVLLGDKLTNNCTSWSSSGYLNIFLA